MGSARELPDSARDTRRMLVLALPGAGLSPKIFRLLRPEEAEVTALDWAAGDSPADPEAVAARIGAMLVHRAGPTVLAGHSIGGVIAMLVAIRHPSLVQGLVISNTGARMEGHGDPALPIRIREAWHAQNQAAFLRSCFAVQPDAQLWQVLVDHLAQVDRSRLLQAVTELRRLDLSGELSRIACPCAVAHGELDTRRPKAAAEALAAGIPDAQLDWLPGGHTPMVDCPQAYQDAVARLLARAAAQGAAGFRCVSHPAATRGLIDPARQGDCE